MNLQMVLPVVVILEHQHSEQYHIHWWGHTFVMYTYAEVLSNMLQILAQCREC